MQEDFPAHIRSSTVLLDLCRQSLKELEELEVLEVQILEDSRP